MQWWLKNQYKNDRKSCGRWSEKIKTRHQEPPIGTEWMLLPNMSTKRTAVITRIIDFHLRPWLHLN